MRMVRLPAAVLAVSLGIAVGCTPMGDPTRPGLVVDNRTDDELTIVYLVDGQDGPNGPTIVRYGTKELGIVRANNRDTLERVQPLAGGCTVAPAIARRADGSEASRLEAGACVSDEVVVWLIE
jgi:hypothetical protein